MSKHRFRPYSHRVYSLVEVTDIKQPAVGTASTYGESVIKEKDPHWRSLIQICSWSGRASFPFKIYLFIYLFIYFWLCWVFVAAGRLSLVTVSRSYPSLLCASFSLRGLLSLQGLLSLRGLLSLQSLGSRHMGFSGCVSRSRAQAQ